MKESKIIDLLRQKLESISPTGTTVRTKGGSDDISDDLPAIIMDWDTDEISTGHIPFSEYTTNDSGEQTGKILVKTFEAEFNLIVKSQSESEKDDMCDSIQMGILPYEEESDLFHVDTSAWNAGGINSRSLQAVEPNWYEGYVPVEFQFVKMTTTSGETITGTDVTINNT